MSNPNLETEPHVEPNDMTEHNDGADRIREFLGDKYGLIAVNANLAEMLADIQHFAHRESLDFDCALKSSRELFKQELDWHAEEVR